MKITEKTAKIFIVDGKSFYTKEGAEDHMFKRTLEKKKKLVEDYLISLYAGNGGNETVCNINDTMFIMSEQARIISLLANRIIDHKDSIPNIFKLLSKIELIGKDDE